MTTPVIEAANCTVSGSNTASTSWTVSHPNASTGDLLIWNIGWDDSTTVESITAPAGPNGETLISIAGPVASASTEVRGQSWYTVATGSWTAGTLTFTPSASESWTATVIRVPSGDFAPGIPIGASATRASAGVDETSVLSPAMTAGALDGGGRLVWFTIVDSDPLSATNPTGWTIRQSQDLGAVAHGIATRDSAVTNSESIAGGVEWTIAGDSWASIAYVVREAKDYLIALSGTAALNGALEANGSPEALIDGVRTWDTVGLQWDASGVEWDQVEPGSAVTLSGTAALAGTLTASGAVDVVLPVSLAGSAALTGTLEGAGATAFPLTLSGTAILAGTLTGQGAVQYGWGLTGSAALSGALTASGTMVFPLALSGTAALTGTLASAGASTATSVSLAVGFAGLDRYEINIDTAVALDIYGVAVPVGSSVPSNAQIQLGLNASNGLAAMAGYALNATDGGILELWGSGPSENAYDLHFTWENAATPFSRTLIQYEITEGSDTLTLPVYVSQSIGTADTGVTHAIIAIHGSTLNASDYFDLAAEIAHGETGTIILAPNFLESATDPDVLYWSTGWRQGNLSATEAGPFRISSYAAMDRLISTLRSSFVNLSRIVLFGHSAGGQYVARYAATQTATDLKFIANGSSSYLWMDDSRPDPQGSTDNDYKYGLDNLSVTGYMDSIGATALRSRFETANCVFLCGSADNRDSNSLDTTAPAMAQGAQRVERLQNYEDHLIDYYGSGISATKRFYLIQGAVHSQVEVFTSQRGRYEVLSG
jgi:pimeloyl-ACP methyl ester carboxylesterase